MPSLQITNAQVKAAFCSIVKSSSISSLLFTKNITNYAKNKEINQRQHTMCNSIFNDGILICAIENKY